MTEAVKLTKAQVKALERLARPGVVCGGVHHKTAAPLVAAGLIGRVSGTREPWFCISEAGRTALSSLSREQPK